jgi:hypothetical protein
MIVARAQAASGHTLQLAYKARASVVARAMIGTSIRHEGWSSMYSESEGLMTDTHLQVETVDPGLPGSVRLVRWFLTVGFLAVLIIEAILVWQAWQTLF